MINATNFKLRAESQDNPIHMHRIPATIDEDNPLSSSVAPGATLGPQSTRVRPNDYTQLIQRLFHGPTAVAIIGTGCGAGFTGLCEDIALDLSSNGRRVVLVSVHALLNSSPLALPDETVFAPGAARNVWLWPHVGQKSEYFSSRIPKASNNWLDSLRANFDAILLRCPTLESAPGGAAIAAMADSAVFAVESRSPKQQILRDQRALQLSGVKLAGCILINPK